ncbi:hypothetical protein JTB14_002878 [Gonioctena quinquepunctata]|nr:hypothetical protein JTB14_002878 [Gonioctena quinquepunctata]
MKYLGYVVDRNGLHVDQDKVKAMLELPTPTNVTEVRRVVETFSWYQRFIPDFSSQSQLHFANVRASTGQRRVHRPSDEGKENVVADALSKYVPIVASLRSNSCLVGDQIPTGTTDDKWYQAMVGKESYCRGSIADIESLVSLMFGIPKVLTCDNGPQYRNNKFLQFADKHRIRMKSSASYNPRANPTERINCTLKTMLAMYISDIHCSWDENLDEIACAIRTSICVR